MRTLAIKKRRDGQEDSNQFTPNQQYINDHEKVTVEPISVCHVNTRFLRGGGPRNTLLTIANLSLAKYRITLVVGEEVNWEQLAGYPQIEVLQIPSMVRAVRPLHDILTVWRLYRLFKKRRFRIVHTHFAKAGVLGRLAARMAGVPIVIHSIHGTTFPPTIPPLSRYVYLTLERVAGAFTSVFIPVAEGLQQEYTEAGVGREGQYRVVHSGFDLASFRESADSSPETRLRIREELGLKAKDLVIGYVANLEPRKGHHHALEMMRRIVRRHPNVVLLLAGEGSHRSRLETDIQAWGLERHVRLLGYRSDIARLLRVLDLKVFTSLWEGLPQALVQAAAAGVPIVAFDVDCVREVVKEGKNGYLVEVGDVDGLTRRVQELLDDPLLRRSMGVEGTAIVDDSWSVEAMVRNTDAVYEEALRADSFPSRAMSFAVSGAEGSAG